MEHRQLGRSGLFVPVLSLGTGTFGGSNEFFAKWGQTDVQEATKLMDVCLDAGLNFFDTADIYSAGASEEILGRAVAGRREKTLIATKATFAAGSGPNEVGSSRHHLIRACEASLRRLGTDYIDLYFMHGFDAKTPVEETLRALDDLMTAGKIRYIGCSNFSGWQVMKSLATSERYGLGRYVSYQGYYSLLHREYEWELMPLALDQRPGHHGVEPARLGPPHRQDSSRRHPRAAGALRAAARQAARQWMTSSSSPVVEALDVIAEETGKTVAQVALNWLLQRPSVCNVVIGARNEEQLRQNLGAVGWSLTSAQVAMLDAANQQTPTYPYWHQCGFNSRNPKPTRW
ncbi:MAG: aldo/keto reductase [Sandaracinaceae bacterium]|nr:aldo/keto reductase [Sandaracinaceae bacterium]